MSFLPPILSDGAIEVFLVPFRLADDLLYHIDQVKSKKNCHVRLCVI